MRCDRIAGTRTLIPKSATVGTAWLRSISGVSQTALTRHWRWPMDCGGVSSPPLSQPASMQYALRVHRGGTRHDAKFIGDLRAVIEAAPKRDGRDIAGYLDEVYLHRIIDGAFRLIENAAKSDILDGTKSNLPPVKLPAGFGMTTDGLYFTDPARDDTPCRMGVSRRFGIHRRMRGRGWGAIGVWWCPPAKTLPLASPHLDRAMRDVPPRAARYLGTSAFPRTAVQLHQASTGQSAALFGIRATRTPVEGSHDRWLARYVLHSAGWHRVWRYGHHPAPRTATRRSVVRPSWHPGRLAGSCWRRVPSATRGGDLYLYRLPLQDICWKSSPNRRADCTCMAGRRPASPRQHSSPRRSPAKAQGTATHINGGRPAMDLKVSPAGTAMGAL